MNNRLQQFLNAENISQSEFADRIGVARASVSHILAGRNKPGFDFIDSMARNYPSLNLEWLISGKGRMYKEASDDLFASHFSEPEPRPARQEPKPSQPQAAPEQTPAPVYQPAAAPAPVYQPAATPAPAAAPVQAPKSSGSRISKIIVFFEDGTYQEVK